MNKIKAIVVDDEQFTRRFIIKLISELNPAFQVLGEAANVKTAYDLILEMRPQVVFLDIRMPDGSGFELLNKFEKIDFEVVFISGFDSYALQAFEFNALDYILKPVEPEKFSRNLNKIQARIEKRLPLHEDIKAIVQSYDLQQLIISKIPLHNGNKVVLLDIQDITSVCSESGYTAFQTLQLQKYLSSKQLADFDFILDQHPCMIKVNKGTVINLNHITSYSKGIVCHVTLKNGSMFNISRRKKQEILELLSGRKEKI